MTSDLNYKINHLTKKVHEVLNGNEKKYVSRAIVAFSSVIVKLVKINGFLLRVFLFPQNTKMILLTFTYVNMSRKFGLNIHSYSIEKIIFGLAAFIFFFLIRNKLKFRNNANNELPTDSFFLKNDQDEICTLSISQLIKMALENNELFYSEFIKMFPDFSDKLIKINPIIKSSDIEFCAMIKLNLDTKQIAQAKKSSVKSVESKKYRIRKKLNISSETDICIWLSKL